jgi:hypothetical protein
VHHGEKSVLEGARNGEMERNKSGKSRGKNKVGERKKKTNLHVSHYVSAAL